MSKSCSTCPSLLTDQSMIGNRFGRASVAAMCGTYGHILSIPKNPEKHANALQTHRALSCDRHGDPLPDQPVEIRPRLRDPIDGLSTTDTPTQNCNNCQHCVKSSVMDDKFGIPVAFCNAKGTLIFRPRDEAKACPYGKPGIPLDSFQGSVDIEFWPDFEPEADILVDMMIGGTRNEPSDYVTDKPLSDADIADGISAWRAIENPKNPEQIAYIPVFRPDVFPESQRLFIPQTGSNEHPEGYIDYAGLLYQFAVDSFTLGETLCLVGKPGLGKTEFARWAAWLMQVPFWRFSFTKATEVDDMIGKTLFDPDRGTYWHDGRITEAYQAHAGLPLLDELNLGPEESREFIRPMIDNSSQLVLDSGLGQTASRGKYVRMLVAINPAWDMRNLGTAELADAETNRMSFALVDYPPKAIEKRIIREACARDGWEVPDKTLEMVMLIASDIRAASDDNLFPGTWGVRQNIKVARKLRWYDVPTAYKNAALNYHDPNVAEVVLDAIATAVG